MRPAPVMLLLGSFATSALAAEAAEIHDPTFHLGYAYAKSSYPPVAGTLTRLTRWQEIAENLIRRGLSHWCEWCA